MPNVTMQLKHVKTEVEQPCAACGAAFVPAEDSGSRVLTVKLADQPAFTSLMCGGCHSKWSHGSTVTLKPAPVA